MTVQIRDVVDVTLDRGSEVAREPPGAPAFGAKARLRITAQGNDLGERLSTSWRTCQARRLASEQSVYEVAAGVGDLMLGEGPQADEVNPVL